MRRWCRAWRLGGWVELGEGHHGPRRERRQNDRRAVAADIVPDDVAALDRTLERVEGPVVLAGHAYAGGVIGATRGEKVRALVYVAALAPDEGETVADVFTRGTPHPQAPKLPRTRTV